ncbi:TMEM165/GDT1 family protein [Alkaliphilus serpentinus]|nr:TMEM165/GDT1 family protein [Alkaliphilus serpentinus]
MISELILGFGMILIAEMGDKTQILAMAFAAKYPVHKVLLGVLVGSFLNHGLAVLLGSYVTNFFPIETIAFIAAISFILFGLWSLRIDHDDEEVDKASKYGPLLTVALAFFVGELGDKTQLTAIALSSKASYPLFILMGTVIGMVVTSAIGVWVGSKLGKKIPELTMKILSSGVFIFFGLIGLNNNAPEVLQTAGIKVGFVGVLAVILATMILKLRRFHGLQQTSLKRVADQLYINAQKIHKSLDELCNDKGCISCQTGKCTIQQLKAHLEEACQNKCFEAEGDWSIPITEDIITNDEKLKSSLKTAIETCLECPNHNKNCVGNQTRMVLETLYFGHPIKYNGVKKEYIQEVKKIDPNFFRS